jgi:glycosyltransferase involved in cell wall biosynthesis
MVNVSVCMAVYNGEKFIIDQLKSILNQLGTNDELIITDDKSKDCTISLIKNLKDDRIVLVQNEEKIGIVKNFEKAISLARGDYIFLSDQDDIWFENKIFTQKSDLEKAILSVSDMEIFKSDDNEIIKESFFKDKGIPSANIFLNNLYKNRFVGSCMAFRKDLIPYILPIPKSCPMHDWWIGLIASLRGDIIFQNKILVKHRHHEFNNSFTSLNKSTYSPLVKFIFRFKMLNLILKHRLKIK